MSHGHGHPLGRHAQGDSSGRMPRQGALSPCAGTIFQNYSDDEKRKIILDEADRCLAEGLTHVHDPGIPSDVQRLLKDAPDAHPAEDELVRDGL
ncbi:MAG: hypothetical protein MZU91_13475 [Desulfosudis oleivorans]|nr:hypothetical protein [Desulfosudis oleivorans]